MSKQQCIMTHQQAFAKCYKKAWEEIRIIRTAPGMVIAEIAIAAAIEKTFSLWNSGLWMLQMRRSGMPHTTIHRIMKIRRKNKEWNEDTIRFYLIEQIPERLHKTIMYQQLVERYLYN